MNCESVLNVEDLYAEGRLSPSRTAAVKAHLKDCPACSARMKSELLSLKGPAVQAPKDLKERMKALLARREAAPEPAAKPWSVDSELWPVAASIAIYLGLALLLSWAGPGVASQKYQSAAAEVLK